VGVPGSRMGVSGNLWGSVIYRKSGWNENFLSAIIKPIFKPIFATLTHEIIKVDLNC
jgi:hypothetical protein